MQLICTTSYCCNEVRHAAMLALLAPHGPTRGCSRAQHLPGTQRRVSSGPHYSPHPTSAHVEQCMYALINNISLTVAKYSAKIGKMLFLRALLKQLNVTLGVRATYRGTYQLLQSAPLMFKCYKSCLLEPIQLHVKHLYINFLRLNSRKTKHVLHFYAHIKSFRKHNDRII